MRSATIFKRPGVLQVGLARATEQWQDMNATYQAQHAEWMDDESPWIGTSHADFEIQTVEALLGTFAIPLGYFLLWRSSRDLSGFDKPEEY